ncbi:Chymotrypsin-2 [Sesbania bispinosa]|nr:Chymotrypsin-2 [Sesbania bispinosa]
MVLEVLRLGNNRTMVNGYSVMVLGWWEVVELGCSKLTDPHSLTLSLKQRAIWEK